MNNNLKVLAKVFLAVALLLMVVLFVWLIVEQKQEKAKIYEEEKNEQEQITQRVRLENEIDQIEEGKPAGKAMAEIVFPDPDKRVYTDIYPKMQEKEYVGVLALSADYAWGEDQTLSEKQIKELEKAGWGVCFYWKADTDIDKYDAWVKETDKAGMDPESVVYFENASYQPDILSSLSDRGTEAVIHHGESQPLVVTEFSEEIVGLGAVGIQSQQPKAYLETAVHRAGNIAFTVGYTLPEELYGENVFDSMLSILKNYEESEKLIVTTPSSALEYQRKLLEEQEKWQEENRERIEELEKEIEKLN